MSFQNKKILAIIPARGGSKGVPKKNIKLLLGKPLIAYTIEAALKSKYLDRIIVSTDDKKIAEISEKYGAEAIKRPKGLAVARSKTIDAVFHLLDVLKRKNYIPDIVVCLQATSPLRTAEDIDKAIELFLKNKCESVVSVCEPEHSPFWTFQMGKKYLRPLFGWQYFKIRRQDLPRVFAPNGAILFISTPKNLSKYQHFYCKNNLPYIMDAQKSIDIDKESDFKLVESLLKK